MTEAFERVEEKWMLEAYDKVKNVVEKKESSEEVKLEEFAILLESEAKKSEKTQ